MCTWRSLAIETRISLVCRYYKVVRLKDISMLLFACLYVSAIGPCQRGRASTKGASFSLSVSQGRLFRRWLHHQKACSWSFQSFLLNGAAKQRRLGMQLQKTLHRTETTRALPRLWEARVSIFSQSGVTIHYGAWDKLPEKDNLSSFATVWLYYQNSLSLVKVFLWSYQPITMLSKSIRKTCHLIFVNWTSIVGWIVLEAFPFQKARSSNRGGRGERKILSSSHLFRKLQVANICCNRLIWKILQHCLASCYVCPWPISGYELWVITGSNFR